MLSPRIAAINNKGRRSIRSSCPLLQNNPAVNNKESPGKNGKATNPVSTNITRKRMIYIAVPNSCTNQVISNAKRCCKIY